jgi:hypothetical protein
MAGQDRPAGRGAIVIVTTMNCPHCQRVLYSRSRATCGYCGGALPEECRLSGGEIAALKAEQLAIERRRARMKEEDEEEEARRRAAAG